MWNNIFEVDPLPQIFIPEFDDSSDSSDEDEFEVNEFMYHTIQKRKEPAAVKQRRRAINRNREEGHKQLMRDYFDEDCVYPEEKFEDRYRVSKRVMLRIAHDLSERYPYFTLRYDARGRRGFTTLQKVTAAFRMLAYGKAADALDEYLRMSEAARKDVECAFGHLKGRWQILKYPVRTWDQDKITTMCLCCVILHNMIIEDEGRAICNFNPEEDQLNPPVIFQMGTPAYISRMLDIQNAEECVVTKWDDVAQSGGHHFVEIALGGSRCVSEEERGCEIRRLASTTATDIDANHCLLDLQV
ncbi:hypothetical protein LXL04_038287 [Taraxacum kok-saghyz]